MRSIRLPRMHSPRDNNTFLRHLSVIIIRIDQLRLRFLAVILMDGDHWDIEAAERLAQLGDT